MNQPDASPLKLVKNYSKGYHKNYLDMNIKYDKKNVHVAKMINGVSEKIQRDYLDLKNFKDGIIPEEGKLTMKELQKLNTVYNKEYIRQIFAEHEEANAYVNVVLTKVMEKETEIIEIIWGIEDINNTWHEEDDAISHKVAEKIA